MRNLQIRHVMTGSGKLINTAKYSTLGKSSVKPGWR
jgi:hypothetical protein